MAKVIYEASFRSLSVSAASVFFAMESGANSKNTILRAWISPAVADPPVDEVVEYNFFVNDAAATVGTSVTPVEVQGISAAASTLTFRSGPTAGATPTDYHFDAFHTQNGMLYLPSAQETEEFMGGSIQDNWGIAFPGSGPPFAMTFSGGCRWLEET